MAFTETPSAWLGAGYSLGTNQAIFNTSNHATPCLPELGNGDAHATSGDIRQIAYALCDKLYNSWVAQASADRPTRMTITRNTSEDVDGNVVRDITFRFYLNGTTALEVIAE